MAEKEKYTKTLTVRLPETVYKAVLKRVQDKKSEFPRYQEADAVRSAIVNHLKLKGYLDKGKEYL